MARSLFEHLSPDTGPKRILALDGGGVKSMLTLGMLKVLEDELRRRASDAAAFRLCDYYDLVGGTSTGAILAAGLALGMNVDQLIEFYTRLGPEVYGRAGGDGLVVQSRFDAKKLRRALQSVLGTKTLGSDDLRTGLAICAKRIDTGSAWVLTNHPLGAFYDPPDGGGFPNKRYRLVDVLMASAGAPSHFDDAVMDIEFDERRKSIQRGYFVDGAVSGANNPGLQMLMLALEPDYKFGWRGGADTLMLTSCGAGSRRPGVDGRGFSGLPPGMRGAHALRSLVFDTQQQGVMVLQGLSQPRRPWPIDHGMADAHGVLLNGAAPLLDYQRMDVPIERKLKARKPGDPAPPATTLERILGRELESEVIDALDLPGNGKKENLDLLLEVGQGAGRTFVDAGYPDPRFDLPEWRA